jgi:hypothetical protein
MTTGVISSNSILPSEVFAGSMPSKLPGGSLAELTRIWFRSDLLILLCVWCLWRRRELVSVKRMTVALLFINGLDFWLDDPRTLHRLIWIPVSLSFSSLLRVGCHGIFILFLVNKTYYSYNYKLHYITIKITNYITITEEQT